ncbi:unnamed protein product [Rodentolepis nana]|uniref:HTH La-type RNA-binding domain-containing protein n=1 Tax=Rodentolepis nana TaxID=102285 RepID=A0A0R3TSB8_RODNA|nr:unnamed protein product [Rodentolepis nana]
MSSTTQNEDLRDALRSEHYTLMSLEELECLLPSHQSDPISTGVLPDGRYFAPRYLNQYFCVFDNRNAYILYFVEHYFSHTNIGRSGAIHALMDMYNSVPLDLVVMANRLASVHVTQDELRVVITLFSHDLMIVNDVLGRSYIKRRDNYWLLASCCLNVTKLANEFWTQQPRIHSWTRGTETKKSNPRKEKHEGVGFSTEVKSKEAELA